MAKKTKSRKPAKAQKRELAATIAPDAAPRTRAQALQSVLDSVTVDTRTPSQRAAEAYRVEPTRYSTAERNAAEHAMDFNGTATNALSFVENTGFPGFPTLALLGQLAEYRSMHETLADECVRMWGKVITSGNAPTEKLADLEEELKRLDIRAAVRELVVQEQAYGRSHAFLKFKGDEGVRELPITAAPYSVPLDSFEGVRPIEAYWVTPNNYNSIDPTAKDFYKPSTWWALGVETHATRMPTIISRPVGDMLKPSYSFAGVSMTQLAMPYVDNWLRTRQSVSDTVKQFSVSGVRMDLAQALLPGGATDLERRAQLINAYRDNRNILFLDLATEEFFQVNTPLSGLDALQAQAQEQMSAVSHIPLIKLLGITPTGLNVTAEGEIRVFYDYVKGYQCNVLMTLMQTILKFVQLSKFGELDPSIGWEWNPLLEMTPKEEGELRKWTQEMDVGYVEAGIVSPQQVAARLNSDPKSPYAGLLADTSDSIEPADDDIAGITDMITNIGNENEAPGAGEEGQVVAANPAQSANGSGVPPTLAEGSGEPDGQLQPLDQRSLQAST
jgi:uncharacterized protein